MPILNNRFRTLAAALAIGTLGAGFSTAAGALATYNATSALAITLDSVSGPGWVGDASGLNDGELTTESGVASNAYTQVSPEFFNAPIVVGQPYGMDAASYGSASDGYAASEAYAELGISIFNPTGGSLTFDFSYTGLIDAAVTGDLAAGEAADAYAALTMFDDLFLVDIFEQVEANLDPSLGFPLLDSLPIGGTFSVTLASGDFDFITAYLDTNGSATGVPTAPPAAPEPASIALLAAGLIGVGAARRRKAA